MRCQVVDELSTDETVPELRRMGVNVIQPPDIVGVTYNWNLARPCSIGPTRMLTSIHIFFPQRLLLPEDEHGSNIRALP